MEVACAPSTHYSRELNGPLFRWTKLVKAVFKAHAGVPLAPKELRSSFITFLRSGDNSDAALKSAAFAMRHSSTQARGPAYDKERSERPSPSPSPSPSEPYRADPGVQRH